MTSNIPYTHWAYFDDEATYLGTGRPVADPMLIGDDDDDA